MVHISHKLGSHRLLYDDRAFRDGLPDLTSGRTLKDAITRLDRAAKNPKRIKLYPHIWIEELEDFGCSVSAAIEKDGREALSVGLPCDGQLEERKRRQDALRDHLHAVDGARDNLIDLLIRRGRYIDHRHASTAEIVRTLRGYLSAGGRVMINSAGHLASKVDHPYRWWDEALPKSERDRLWSDVRRWSALARRYRADNRVKRIVRRLGSHLPNGWIVLEAKAEPQKVAA